MFAVVFEVQPKRECWSTYLDLARHLKAMLEATEGFVDNERFESQRTQGRVLSLSTWRDEKALVRWRTHAEHHHVQAKGRFEIFQDYHLRVGEITSDTREVEVGGAACTFRLDTTEVGRAKVLTITEVIPTRSAPGLRAESLAADLGLPAEANGLLDQEVFASIYTPGKLLLLASWASAREADAFAPRESASLGELRHRQISVIRDYGMRDRREAPQYYPSVDVERASGSCLALAVEPMRSVELLMQNLGPALRHALSGRDVVHSRRQLEPR